MLLHLRKILYRKSNYLNNNYYKKYVKNIICSYTLTK